MNRFCKYLGLWCLLPAAAVNAAGTVEDMYGPVVEWRQAAGLDPAPIHAGLLPNGKLFFVSTYNFLDYPDVDLLTPGFIPEYVFLMETTPAFTPEPATVIVEPLLSPIPPSFDYDAASDTADLKTLVCSGHSLTADGSLFFASGARAIIDMGLYNSGQLAESLTLNGLAETLSYNSFTDTWTQHPDLVGPGPQTGEPLRWYATVTRLADERMLVTGGYELVIPEFSYNTSVEVFDVNSNAWSVVSDLNDTPPGVENPDYTHVFQFPYDYTGIDSANNATNFDLVMMLGGSGEPFFLFLNGPTKFWYHTQKYRPGAKEYLDASPDHAFPNHGSSSSLLPIRLPESGWGYSNGSIINVSGAHFTPMEGNIDVYDPGTNSWRPSISMGGLRHHNSTVILPDGRILILAGHDDVSPVKKTGYAQYVDPKNNFDLSTGVAYMPETRGYHTVAVLLPDGRVLLGGGNKDGKDGLELPNFRYYYPDYMFKARPGIVYAEDTIKYTDYSIFFVPHMTNVDEASLMGLGSMTHSFDMNQRNVQMRVLDLGVTVKYDSGTISQVGPDQCVDNQALCFDAHAIQAPDTPEIAPPGYYMFFILDENRVPSMGKMIKLEGT